MYRQFLTPDYIFFARYQIPRCSNFAPWYSGDTPRWAAGPRSTRIHALNLAPIDPFVFSGTIRSSLDFDGKHQDDALWHALDLVGLNKFVASQESKLDTVVQDNGSNYSIGQRQLLCLAAAILRNPRILLLDEATASIEAGADVFVQQAMRRSCPRATILSVMHRLNDRILEACDRVLVMEQGVAIEYAPPRELIGRPDSTFARLMAAARNQSIDDV